VFKSLTHTLSKRYVFLPLDHLSKNKPCCTRCFVLVFVTNALGTRRRYHDGNSLVIYSSDADLPSRPFCDSTSNVVYEATHIPRNTRVINNHTQSFIDFARWSNKKGCTLSENSLKLVRREERWALLGKERKYISHNPRVETETQYICS